MSYHSEKPLKIALMEMPEITGEINTPVAVAALEIGENVIFQALDDEVVLLNLSSQQYYGLDDVGAAMWKSLLEHRTVDSAAASLDSQYAIDSGTLRRDLSALAQSLLDAGLLKRAT